MQILTANKSVFEGELHAEERNMIIDYLSNVKVFLLFFHVFKSISVGLMKLLLMFFFYELLS